MIKLCGEEAKRKDCSLLDVVDISFSVVVERFFDANYLLCVDVVISTDISSTCLLLVIRRV